MFADISRSPDELAPDNQMTADCRPQLAEVLPPDTYLKPPPYYLGPSIFTLYYTQHPFILSCKV
jgi:hypothetical protein